MSITFRRAALAAAVLLSTTFRAPSVQARPAAFSLDGLRDDGYQLLAQDPAGDLAAGFASAATNWADLTNLYVTSDTTSLWVYVDLPNYGLNSVGQFGLAIDTDGLAASGGASDPAATGMTFAYTSTRNNVNTSPVVTTGVLLPDVVIHGNLFNASPDVAHPLGWTELNQWTGAAWNGVGTNWGGIADTMVGTHIGFAYGHGIELSIPYADLGLWPTSTVHLEFYALGRTGFNPQTGAVDTVPADTQAQAEHEATTQRRLATFGPATLLATPRLAFSSPAYAVSEAQGDAPITITVAPTSTQMISFTFATTSGTASAADYLPVSQVVSVGPGSAAGVVDVHVLTDTLTEPDETVILSLSQAVGAQLGQPVTATLTIHDSPSNGLLGKLYLPLTRR